MFVKNLQKRPKIGALLGTILRRGTLGRWGDRPVSGGGAVATATTPKTHRT